MKKATELSSGTLCGSRIQTLKIRSVVGKAVFCIFVFTFFFCLQFRETHFSAREKENVTLWGFWRFVSTPEVLSGTYFFLALEVCFSTHTPTAPLKLLIVVVESSHRGQAPCACPPVNRYAAPERAVIVFERLTFMMISFRLVITRDVCVSQLIGAVTSILILRSPNVFFSANDPITLGNRVAFFFSSCV